MSPSGKTLVTGGVRSGRSFHAEALVVAEPLVTYVATGPSTDRSRRPAAWVTVEDQDLAGALERAEGAVLVDCIGDWVHWMIGELDGWDAVREDWEPRFAQRVEDAADALARRDGPVVLVTQEVGMGAESGDLRDHLFRELLGYTNQRLALECDDVLLVVAGRAITL